MGGNAACLNAYRPAGPASQVIRLPQTAAKRRDTARTGIRAAATSAELASKRAAASHSFCAMYYNWTSQGQSSTFRNRVAASYGKRGVCQNRTNGVAFTFLRYGS